MITLEFFRILDGTLSKYKALNYTLSVMILVILSCLGIVLYKFKKLSKKEKISTRQQTSRIVLTHQTPNSNIGENDYDEINDEIMIDMDIPIFHRGNYSNVIFDSRSVNSSQSPSNEITEAGDTNSEMGIQIDKAEYLLPDGNGVNHDNDQTITADKCGSLFPKRTNANTKTNYQFKTDTLGYLSPDKTANNSKTVKVDVHDCTLTTEKK